jgi:MFS family permease
MIGESGTAKRVVVTYVLLGGLFTLGASLIWAINTIFLIRVGGLDLFQTMVVNSAFTVSQMVFEVPTGVVADTTGRRVSLILSMLILVLSTLLYVFVPIWGWGMPGFLFASALLGLGYTFQTGAMEAWLVDALDSTGWALPKERVFSWGQIAMGIGMVAGSLLGGVLGQFNLTWPYLARTGLLFVCLIATVVLVRDQGFEPRPLRWSTFGAETRHILMAGVRYGWGSPVVRPLLWTSAISGAFFMFGFYAWQPYILQLLDRDYVWLLGVVQAGSSAAGILGNSLVGRVMKDGDRRRDPARVLVATTVTNAVIVVAIGAVGFLSGGSGVLAAGIAIALWLGWGVMFGVSVPIRMSYINEHIPSSERATVLSLDAFFSHGGAAAGQPALGWLAQRTSISAAWLVGGALVASTAPLYARSGSAAAAMRVSPEELSE